MTVQTKLQKCRVELQQKGLKKSGKNNFAGFTYFELADFLPTVNEMFAKNNLFSNFSMTDVLATLEIVDVEDNTKVIFTSPIAELELKGCNKIQALGGTHTYLKRYLYVNALEIVEADLFDSTSGRKEVETIEKSEKVKCRNCGKEISEKMSQAFGGLCSSCKQKGVK